MVEPVVGEVVVGKTSPTSYFMNLQLPRGGVKESKEMEKFIRPPEAPIFYPTEEEFESPMKYIEKIKPVAEKFGICKIIPPPGWLPPFCLDPDKLEFKPRMQHLGMVDALTRLRAQWVKKLELFWTCKGSRKVSLVQSSKIDLYELNELVVEKKKDGRELQMDDWMAIAMKLKNDDEFIKSELMEEFIQSLVLTYNDLILPMTEFWELNKGRIVASGLQEQAPRLLAMKASSRKSRKPVAKMNARKSQKKLKRLNSAPTPPSLPIIDLTLCSKCLVKITAPTEETLETENCGVLTCQLCKRLYHSNCIASLPTNSADTTKSAFSCDDCVVRKLEASEKAFGFGDSSESFTLASFGNIADFFKKCFFDVEDPTSVPEEVVERVFWGLLSQTDAPSVMYGADLHAKQHGSGFPTTKTLHLDESDKKYVDCGWNLNNIAHLEDSVLRFINGDVSGMKIPWLYVGMCFSTFCWHIEDHWTASINYLHLGEPKTWYGVPGSQADLFESKMKELTPQLFDSQPDLLHQLVTNYNPTHFLSAVDICRTDQRAGEFVITFPRAYHAGFNQGFNFAEAVNFCMSDWIPVSMQCSKFYALQGRENVFSMEEVLSRMARDSWSVTCEQAEAAKLELRKCLENEIKIREDIRAQGLKKEVRRLFEKYTDDARTCIKCKTTVFFSAIRCTCDNHKDILMCPSHYEKKLSFPDCAAWKVEFMYRYTIEEIEKLVDFLESQANAVSKRTDGLDMDIEGCDKGIAGYMELD